jgi:DNA replication licensing factor MCM7
MFSHSALLRRYELHFIPQLESDALPLRKIRAEHIGHLVKTRGIVIRASELMPQVTVAVYLCDKCGCEAYQEVTAKNFMPLFSCESPKCKGKKENAGSLHMQTRGSKFVKFQEIRIQELPDEVPVGHVPRSIICQVRGEITRRVTPGDIVRLDGVFLPIPFQGYQVILATRNHFVVF